MNLAALRLQNLFGNPLMSQDNPDEFGSSVPINNGAPQQTLDNYQPRNAVSSQLTNTLLNMPERQPPGMLRRVAAAIAGAGSGSSPAGIVGGQPIGFRFNPQEAEMGKNNVLDNGYNRQLGDWQNRVKALGMGAQEEDKANTNERMRLFGQEANAIKAGKNENEVEKNRIADEKNRNIFETKMGDLQRKIDEAQAKIDFANKKLEQNATDAQALRDLHKAETDALNARHAMDIAQKDRQLEELTRSHGANEALKANPPTIETNKTVTRDSQGNVTGVTETRGPKSSSSNTNKVVMIGPDGKQYQVPADKVQDALNRGMKRVQ